jgi:hypothetical protein
MARLELLSAAIRHIRDAEFLASTPLPNQSLDQAFHLAGFGPECARKATWPRATFDKAIGHDTTDAAEASLAWALAHDPRARRYQVDLVAWHARYPALASWTTDTRYDQTGTHSQPQVNVLLTEARAAVTAILTALWIDGVLDKRFMTDLASW